MVPHRITMGKWRVLELLVRHESYDLMHKTIHSSFSSQLAGQDSICTGLQPAVGTYQRAQSLLLRAVQRRMSKCSE